MDKKVYLSGTSLLPNSGIDRNTVFLIGSAVSVDTASSFNDNGYNLIPELWQDRRRLNEAVAYLDAQHEKLSGKIGLLLSRIHGVSYPELFWEIPMAGWLMNYIHVLYDRYARLKKAIELYGKDNLVLLACKGVVKPTSSYSEFLEQTSIDEVSASILYGKIARELGIIVSEFDVPEGNMKSRKSYAIPQEVFSRAKFQKLSLSLKYKLSNIISAGFPNKPSLLMTNYGLNVREKSIFAKKFNATFFTKEKIRFNPEKIDRSFLLSLKGEDDFENIAIKLMPFYLPAYLLENFKAYEKEAGKLAHFKAYLSSNGWYTQALFCYAASLGRLNNAKIIGWQHGGSYGQFEKLSMEFIERKFCDFYITWGWDDALYKGARLLPLAQPVLSRNANTHKAALGKVLWSGTTMPRQTERLMAYNPEVLPQYLQDKKDFLANLNQEVRSSLVYRPHPVDCGWLDKELGIFKDYPEIGIETHNSLPETLKKVKLYICDHQSTSFLQALATNTPTILFWSTQLASERPSALPLFNRLRQAKILFHDPKEAAVYLNNIWDNVEEWWQEKERQDARGEFVNTFAKVSPNWQEEWIKKWQQIL